MAVSLEKALSYEFVMRDNGVVVAMGKASAVMLYEMQRAFAGNFTSCQPASYDYIRGAWISLEQILGTPPLATDCWQALGADRRIFDFWYQKREDNNGA